MEHIGTADWLNDNEIDKILGRNDVPGIILGKRVTDIIKLPFDCHFNKNIAVFGSSGSMKTIGFLITNLLELLQYKKSIIVTDAKGEIYRKTNTIFRESGYVVKVFNLKDILFCSLKLLFSVLKYIIAFKKSILALSISKINLAPFIDFSKPIKICGSFFINCQLSSFSIIFSDLINLPSAILNLSFIINIPLLL